jgi:hypothetical protein
MLLLPPSPVPACLLALGGLFLAPGAAAAPAFNRDIRPILSENCFPCHGQDEKHRGGKLRLDLREDALAERDGGPAIVPGKPAASALLKRVRSPDPELVMPPPDSHRARLTPDQINRLETWIAQGAAYQPHWAFVAPEKSPLPGDPAGHPVDAFIRAKLTSAQLPAAPPADDPTLVRRVFLDLTGLPPSPADIASYLAEPPANRWERLVDRLLASPHCAERLALPWLDASRYADTNGFSIDDHRDAWAWRDWVINAFAQNQRYDQFLTDQIAGDLIPGGTPDERAATGFLRNGMSTHEGGIIPEEYRVAGVIDKVDAVASTTLGLTLKCAQCHDHKFDPITQKEYYRFFAFFNTSSEPGLGETNANTPPLMDYTPPLAQGGMAGLRARIAELEYLQLHPTAPVVAARSAWEAKQTPAPSSAAALAEALALAPPQRQAAHWRALNEGFMASGDPLAGRMRSVLASLAVEIEVLRRDVARGKTTVMVMDHHPELRKTQVLIRGLYDQPGEEVSAGVPAILPPLVAGPNPTRLDLARWITDARHPLTARVEVNRLWQMIFGRGLVETAGDFGSQGTWPTHPELLDWLAVDFTEHHWDVRHVLRTLLTSETYRQSAAATPQALAKDPRNELLSRSPRTRLGAEILRDAALAAAGLLDPAVGGPSVHPPQPELWREISHFGHPTVFTAQHFYPGRQASHHRRSLYTFWKRTSPPPTLGLFDAPTRETCAQQRGQTNTPLQALVLLNDPQFVEAGLALGRRMLASGSETPSEHIAFGFRLIAGRAPTPAEQQVLSAALARHLARYAQDPAAARSLLEMPTASDAQAARLAAYGMLGCTLLNLDEAITRP